VYRDMESDVSMPSTSVALFAGIGGLELGLSDCGIETQLFCDIDPAARTVLSDHFPSANITSDVRELRELPETDLLTAGFPCQDLSQVGRRAGISGGKSSIVSTVFKLIRDASKKPDWVLIENVPFMLRLDQGAAMSYLVTELERLGYTWAYRVVDARAFGIPQRRRRVFLLASLVGDPRLILADQAEQRPEPAWDGETTGFYWTEGNRGLGWAPGAVPTLKGGSGLGIPSPPAVWVPGKTIGTPDIRDAERLQGFSEDWTRSVSGGRRGEGARWRLVGNAVCVPVARWIGGLLIGPEPHGLPEGLEMLSSAKWPTAAWGAGGRRFEVPCGEWPQSVATAPIAEFLRHPLKPLSHKATAGFYSRLSKSGLSRPAEFDEDLVLHIARMARESATVYCPS